MNIDNFAIVVDTGCDLPTEFQKRDDVFVLPFHILYGEKDFIDGVDITADDVYAELPDNYPKTSLPSGEEILSTFDTIKEQGFHSALVINISSKLSGTHNMINLMVKSYEGLRIHTIDTKNVSIGAGFVGIAAILKKDAGKTFEEVVESLKNPEKKTQIFYTPGTLYYLKRGGRIGLVSSLLGSALKIKPVVSCNSEGIYYVVSKVRRSKQALERTGDEVRRYRGQHKPYYISIYHGDVPEKAAYVKEKIKDLIDGADYYVEGRVSAALGLNVGPDMVGIGIYLDEA